MYKGFPDPNAVLASDFCRKLCVAVEYGGFNVYRRITVVPAEEHPVFFVRNNRGKSSLSFGKLNLAVYGLICSDCALGKGACGARIERYGYFRNVARVQRYRVFVIYVLRQIRGFRNQNSVRLRREPTFEPFIFGDYGQRKFGKLILGSNHS